MKKSYQQISNWLCPLRYPPLRLCCSILGHVIVRFLHQKSLSFSRYVAETMRSIHLQVKQWLLPQQTQSTFRFLGDQPATKNDALMPFPWGVKCVLLATTFSHLAQKVSLRHRRRFYFVIEKAYHKLTNFISSLRKCITNSQTQPLFSDFKYIPVYGMHYETRFD